MKIAFDAKRLYNNFTGLGNHSRTTIDILTDFYPSTELFLYTPKARDNDVTHDYLHRRNCHTVTPKGLLRGALWRTFALGKQALADGAEVFHGLSNELPAGLKLPSVVTIHDVAFRQYTDMYHWQDRKIYDIKWKHAVNNATRVIAISECTKQDIMKFYGIPAEKIDVVYQPVGLRYYNEVEARPESLFVRTPYMLYVGSINSRKNLLGIVKAMRKVPEELLIPLVVVGNGREYKAEVQRYIVENGMQKWVVFPNKRITDDTLHQLYLNATMFVYPSFYEGFGLPVVEAALCKCPVLTSNISSLPEAAGPSALLADPYSTTDIAQKMTQILADGELRERMGREGRAYAMRTFHPKVLAERLMEVYEKAIKEG